jgi:hypothetical protein
MNITASLKPFRFAIEGGTPQPTVGTMGFQTIVQYDTLSPGEYNPALQGAKAIGIYDRMRRSDGQANAVELITSLPVCALDWRVDPGGKGSTDKEAAELIQTNLLEAMAVSWAELLRQMLLSLMYGFSVHEIVYAVEGKYVRWDDFFHIPHASVEEFQYDQGRLSAIRQVGSTYDGSQADVTIPADKLLTTTYRMEGGNVAGFPLFRPMYKHWWCKDVAYTILGMAIECLIMGVPWAKVPKGTNDEQKRNLLSILENIRARDKRGVVLDSDIDLNLLESKRDLKIVLDYISHHDIMMARTALAQFLNLGATEVGARGLSEDHSKIFMIAEQALADMVATVMNRGPIPRLCQYNWPGLQVFPKLTHSHIRTVLRLEPVLEALAHLVAGSLVTPELDLENRIRQLLDLPELAAPAARADKSAEPAGDEPPDEGGSADAADQSEPDDQQRAATAPAIARARAHAACEHQPLAFADPQTAAIGALFEQTNDTFQRTAGKLLDDMITKLHTAARTALGKVSQPFSRARLYTALQAIELPGQARYAAAVRDYLTTLAGAGRQAAAEIAGADVPAASADERNHIKAQADLLAKRHVAELKAVFIQQILSGALTDVPVAQAVDDAAQAGRDRVSTEFSSWFREALAAFTTQLSQSIYPQGSGS